MSGFPELTGLAVAVLVAVVCGVLMTRLRQPAIVGYILAGVVLGPSGLAIVRGREPVTLLAELGVLLLLFVIGMELSLRGFRGVWRTALVATLLQVGGSVAVTLLLSVFFDWEPSLAILLGFVVALSSTAVVIKMLEEMNILRTPVAQITVGVLIAQDLAFVPMMLTVGALAGDAWGGAAALKIAFSIVFLALFILYLSRRRRIRLPLSGVVAGHADLTPLRGLGFCIGAAAVTAFAGLTPAYGAFLAGLAIGSSTERAAMLGAIQPIQSILMMAFFLSIGLLIDLDFILANLDRVLLFLAVVIVFKTALNIGALRLAGQPLAHAFITGLLLAQIGEFSFILGQAGAARGLVTAGESNLIIAVTALSLVISPLWMFSVRRLLRIAILGVTSGREIWRLFLGKLAPAWFAVSRALDALSPRRRAGPPPEAAPAPGAGEGEPGTAAAPSPVPETSGEGAPRA